LKTEADVTKLVATLKAMDVDSFYGKLKWDDAGRIQKPMFTQQLQVAAKAVVAPTGTDTMKFPLGVSSCWNFGDASKGTTAAPTTAPIVKKVKVTYTFKQLVFSKLTTKSTTAMKTAVQDGVLAGLGAGYTKDHVMVTLKAGSVIAVVTVTPVAGKTAAALEESLTATTQTTMKNAVLAKVKVVPSIDKALADGKTISDLAVTQSAVMVITTGKNEPKTVSGAAANMVSVAMVGLFATRMLA